MVLLHVSKDVEQLELVHCWAYKMVQPLWKQLLIKLNIHLPWDPPIPLLGIFLNEQKVRAQIDLHSVTMTALFITAKNWKQPNCPSGGECMKFLQHRSVHAMRSSLSCYWYLAMWIGLKTWRLSERSKYRRVHHIGRAPFNPPSGAGSLICVDRNQHGCCLWGCWGLEEMRLQKTVSEPWRCPPSRLWSRRTVTHFSANPIKLYT